MTFIGALAPSWSSTVDSAAIWKFSGAAGHAPHAPHMVEQHSDLWKYLFKYLTPRSRKSAGLQGMSLYLFTDRRGLWHLVFVRFISHRFEFDALVCWLGMEFSHLHAAEMRRMLTGGQLGFQRHSTAPAKIKMFIVFSKGLV